MTAVQPTDPIPAAAPPRPRFVLTIQAGPDPLARTHGDPERAAHYRLKLVLKRVLRDHGFRAIEVREVPPTC